MVKIIIKLAVEINYQFLKINDIPLLLLSRNTYKKTFEGVGRIKQLQF